jgi:uncharacterized protein (DUF1800 family)
VTGLLRALFTDPAFTGTAHGLVKQPVEWAVGAMRQLGIRPARLPADAQKQLLRLLDMIGQPLFAPPSVGGWPAGTAWLSTSATEYRVRLASVLAGQTDPAKIPKDIDSLARLLVVDGFTPRTRAALAGAGKDTRKLLTLALVSPEYAVC